MKGIRVEGLTKTFAVREAVTDTTKRASHARSLWLPWRRSRARVVQKVALSPLSFEVQQGEAIAFIGPNGAGKSTTIKMLTGILYPTAGHAQVLGLVPWQQRVALARQIGTVFGQKSQLWYHLPADDSFSLMAHIYDMKRGDFLARKRALIAAFDLSGLLSIPVRKLSLGERMRAEIALALLHRPQILFLDEPTIGLDVVMKRAIREQIAKLHQEEGVTVFLTSHDASDMEELCQRALVIDRGELLFDDLLMLLKERYLRVRTIHLRLREAGPAFERQGVTEQRLGDYELALHVDLTATGVEPVLSAAMGMYAIEDVTIESPRLEDAIAKMYTDTAHARGVG